MLYLINFFERFLGEGGDLTLFMTGRKPRPHTEPMYSGGNRDDFPITLGYDSVVYKDLIGSHIQNSENIVICQSFYNGYLSGCFAPSERYSPRPSVSWRILYEYDSFLQEIEKTWKLRNGESKQIYSLAFDEIAFGAFFMKNYGTDQTIVTNVLDIEKVYEEGFRLTACAARGSTFSIVMTKDTDEYHGKNQKWFTRTSWEEVGIKLEKQYKKGRAVTGICYSTGQGRYFVVLTETPQKQKYKWFDHSDTTIRDDWMDAQHKEGYHPTIIFKDPTDEKILVVMTMDENRSGYSCRFDYKVADLLWPRRNSR